jgi:hypothetical protein
MNPRTTGRALVISKAGLSYVADVTIDGDVVHACRVRYRFGACGEYSYQRVEDRAWPMSELREVRWLTNEVVGS